MGAGSIYVARKGHFAKHEQWKWINWEIIKEIVIIKSEEESTWEAATKNELYRKMLWLRTAVPVVSPNEILISVLVKVWLVSMTYGNEQQRVDLACMPELSRAVFIFTDFLVLWLKEGGLYILM